MAGVRFPFIDLDGDSVKILGSLVPPRTNGFYFVEKAEAAAGVTGSL